MSRWDAVSDRDYEESYGDSLPRQARSEKSMGRRMAEILSEICTHTGVRLHPELAVDNKCPTCGKELLPTGKLKDLA